MLRWYESSNPARESFGRDVPQYREMETFALVERLLVEKPTWMIGDSAYNTLDWHDHPLAAEVVQVTPYNA